MIKQDPEPGEPIDPAVMAADYRFRQQRQFATPRNAPARVRRGLFVGLVFAATFAVVAFGVREVNERASASQVTPATQAAPSAGARPMPLPEPPVPRAAERDANVRTLRTCVSGAGDTLVTDSPCPAGYATASAREFVPDRGPPPRRTAPASTASRSAPAPGYVMPAGQSNSERARRQCDAAKAHEADYRERRGLKITYDELSQLSEQVRRACADT